VEIDVGGRVVVVGGGFSGVAAACRLAGDGHRPILFERSGRLGGRAASFRDPATGEVVDDGHHVSMRCCTATHGLLQRIRATTAIRYQSEMSIPIWHPGGQTRIRSVPLLPGALHAAPALLGYRALSFGERLRALHAGAALLFPSRSDIPLGRWLRSRRQASRAISRLWDPICIATLNAHVDDVSFQAARKVFRSGLLSPGGGGLGLFTRPLDHIFEATREYIESHGGEVRTASRVQQIHVEEGRVCAAELATGETVETSAVIAAVLPTELGTLLRDPLLRRTIEAAEYLTWSPIVNAHVWLDRSILDGDFFVAVDSPIQAVFNVTKLHARAGDDGCHLVISQSAADPWIDRSPDDIADELVEALAEIAPAARAARVDRRVVIKHRRATFVPAPGVDALRPPAKAPIDGLYLAGDWTATGWPSTIEGAVRSGVTAAARAEPTL